MLILIGPFHYMSYDRKTKRMRVEYRDENNRNVPSKYLNLYVDRIYEAYYIDEGHTIKEEYYLYDTDKIDFYKNYTTVLPPNAVKRNEMIFSHYECPDGYVISDLEASEWLTTEGVIPCEIGGTESYAVEKIDYDWKPKPIPPGAKIIAGDDKPEAILPKLFGNVNSLNKGAALIFKIISKKTVDYENKKINVIDGIGYVDSDKGIDAGEIEIYNMDDYYAYKMLKPFSFEDFEKNADIFNFDSEKLEEIQKNSGLPKSWYLIIPSLEQTTLGRYIIEKFKDIDEKRKIDLIEKISNHNLRVLAEILPQKYAEEYALSEIKKGIENPSSVREIINKFDKYLSEQTKQTLLDIGKKLEEKIREEQERELEKRRKKQELEKQLEKEQKERNIEVLKQIMKQVNEEFKREGIKARVKMENYLDLAKIIANPTSYMSKSDFDKYIEILKDYGFRYNPRNKTWSIDVSDINNGFTLKKKLKI